MSAEIVKSWWVSWEKMPRSLSHPIPITPAPRETRPSTSFSHPCECAGSSK